MKFSLILFRIQRYVWHWLFRTDEHSLQAPFVFQLYNTCFKTKWKLDADISQLWEEYKRDQTTIPEEAGEGSQVNSKQYRISRIAKYGVTTPKNAGLIASLIGFASARRVLELGTSLGIHAAILSRQAERVVSVDSNPALTQIAKQGCQVLGIENVELHTMDIGDFLQGSSGEVYDLIYLDANHSYEATVEYSSYLHQMVRKSQGLVIYDDINWSAAMRQAWEEIVSGFAEGVVLETYQMGILIFDPRLQRQYHILAH